jgi:hypothetical protein
MHLGHKLTGPKEQEEEQEEGQCDPRYVTAFVEYRALT